MLHFGPAVIAHEVIGALESIDGLAPDTGLKRFGGRSDKYIALLRAYADAHAEDGKTLRDHLASGRLEEARQLAHAIKGASAMLGATGIQTLAAGLEIALASHAPPVVIECAAANYLAAREALAAAIRAAL